MIILVRCGMFKYFDRIFNFLYVMILVIPTKYFFILVGSYRNHPLFSNGVARQNFWWRIAVFCQAARNGGYEVTYSCCIP